MWAPHLQWMSAPTRGRCAPRSCRRCVSLRPAARGDAEMPQRSSERRLGVVRPASWRRPGAAFIARMGGERLKTLSEVSELRWERNAAATAAIAVRRAEASALQATRTIEGAARAAGAAASLGDEAERGVCLRAKAARARGRARVAAIAADAWSGGSVDAARQRCIDGGTEETSQTGLPFDTGWPNDAGGGIAKSTTAGRERRSAEEETRLGREYDGPRVAAGKVRFRTPARLAAALRQTNYHDGDFVSALEEMEHSGGFPLCFEGRRDETVEIPNSWSSWENVGPAHELLRAQFETGTMLLFETRPPWKHYRTAPYFALAKRKFGRVRPGKWRGVRNASATGLRGEASLNDGIPAGPKLVLGTVLAAGRKVQAVQDAYPKEIVRMKTIDFKNAFPALPQRHCDVPLQGMRWFDPRSPLPPGTEARLSAGGALTADDEAAMVYLFPSTLELGSRSSMSWFCRFSEAIVYLAHHREAPIATPPPADDAWDTETYVDDIFVCATESAEARAQQRIVEAIGLAGEPDELISWEKDLPFAEEGVFLGTIMDLTRRTLSMPDERVEDGLKRLRAVIRAAYLRTTELRSLVGCLQHAARCAPRVRTFLRRFWDALRAADGRKRRFTRIGRGCRIDAQLLLRLWPDINGVPLVPGVPTGADAVACPVFTDASGHVTDDDGSVTRAGGYGGVNLERLEWFAGEWPAEAEGLDINPLEAATVLMAGRLWGRFWRGREVGFGCDNMSTVAALRPLADGGGATRDAALMTIIRRLYFEEAKHGFAARVFHVPGVKNRLADFVSRGLFDEFAAECHALGLPPLTRVEPPDNVPALLNVLSQARAAREAAAQCSGRRRRS